MELRSAFPLAVLLGVILGAATVGLRSSGADLAANTSALTESSEEESGTRWDFPVVWNEPVERFVNLFSQKQTDRMAVYLKRSGQYEGMIRGKLRENGLPEDLLYLSMIESGFNPTARSPAQAVGLWQFIAETGRRYGLRIDSYVDERRDPEKSTEAAVKYLTYLHDRFGSWHLAAAGYNTGENRVARIMREETGSEKGTEEDFWRIRHRLPRETREYVPLIVAAALVGKEPHKYGLENVERMLPPAVEKVAVPGGVPLAVVAKSVGVSERAIGSLNPHLVRGMTPPGGAYEVRIPEGRGAQFAANFESTRAEHARLAKAAAAKQPTRVATAATAKKAPAKAAAKQPARATQTASARRTHQVRKGESLSVIAKRHNTSVPALQRANGLGKKTTIRAGQTLRIPAR